MDPITFEIIRHRLFRVIEEGVITLKHVSGSEITCEGHDLMVALHRADGSLLLAGIGYLHHTPSAAEACKHIVRRFAGEIDEHDVFLLNDPYTAAHHTSDIYLISPIHHEGRLVAWSSSFVHVNDIGATNPGGFCPDATEIYVEGFSSPGIKLIARGELRQDLLDTICNMVRSPALVTLDLKSMIACHNVAKERMQALYGKYGAATVDEACAALIEQSDRRFGQRLEELPDGRWQSRQRLHCRGEDYLVALTMTKEGGRLTFDFSGTSEQSRYAINSPYWATWGAIFSPIFSVLCPDMVWNEGLTRRVTMVAPEGSIINSRRPAPISVSTIATVPMVNWSSLHCISKMLATSPRHERYATAVWDGGYNAVFMFGRDQRGNYTIGYMTDVFGGAGGARSYADGVDVGGDIPNPITRTANVETTEARLPVRYLFPTPGSGRRRRRAPPWRRRDRIRGDAARRARRRPPFRDDGQGHALPHQRGDRRRLCRLAAALLPGAHAGGRRRAGQVRHHVRRALGRARCHRLGRVPADGQGRAVCRLERRRRLGRSPDARARRRAQRRPGRPHLGA